jgi:hypothetical protein
MGTRKTKNATIGFYYSRLLIVERKISLILQINQEPEDQKEL